MECLTNDHYKVCCTADVSAATHLLMFLVYCCSCSAAAAVVAVRIVVPVVMFMSCSMSARLSPTRHSGKPQTHR